MKNEQVHGRIIKRIILYACLSVHRRSR